MSKQFGFNNILLINTNKCTCKDNHNITEKGLTAYCDHLDETVAF